VSSSPVYKYWYRLRFFRLPSKVLRELGISLGHVAAFVEEVEVKVSRVPNTLDSTYHPISLQDGLLSGERDPRGVHGMRKLALQLETIAKESSDKVSRLNPLTRVRHSCALLIVWHKQAQMLNRLSCIFCVRIRIRSGSRMESIQSSHHVSSFVL
jgi:hypothetical protein